MSHKQPAQVPHYWKLDTTLTANVLHWKDLGDKLPYKQSRYLGKGKSCRKICSACKVMEMFYRSTPWFNPFINCLICIQSFTNIHSAWKYIGLKHQLREIIENSKKTALCNTCGVACVPTVRLRPAAERGSANIQTEHSPTYYCCCYWLTPL